LRCATQVIKTMRAKLHGREREREERATVNHF